MDAFKLQSSIEFNIDDVVKGLDKVDKSAKNTDKNIDKVGDTAKKSGDKFSSLGNMAQKGLATVDKWARIGATAVGALATGMLALGIKSNASLETSQTAWTTLLGTQEASKKMIDDITNYAAKTPFSKMGVDEMAKQLHNAGFAGDDLFNQLTKFGNMGSAFAIQEDSLKEMVRQYGQVQMAGYAYTEDLNILQDRGIPIYKALSETLGVSVADIKRMASEGKLTADIYNNALNSIASGTEGAMDAQSKTFSGMLSTIKDNIVTISQKILEPLFGKIIEIMPQIIEVTDVFTAKLDEGKGIVESLKEAIGQVFGDETVSKIQTVIGVVTGLMIAYGLLKGVMFVSNLVSALAGAYTALSTALGISTTATTVATGAQTGLNLAFLASPITWIIAGIVAIIAIFVLLWNNCEGFRNFWIGMWDNIKSSASAVWDWLSNLFTVTIPNAFNTVVNFFANNWQTILGFLVNPFGTGFKLLYDKCEAFRNFIDGIVGGIKNAFSSITDTFRNVCDSIGRIWDNIRSMIKLPHFSMSGEFSLVPPSIPKIGVDWYSTGGIFTKPTVLGNIGVGDANNGKGSNAEAVIPLDEMYRNMESMFIKYSSRPLYLDIDARNFLRATAHCKDEWEKYDYRNAGLSY